jgi:hypothetical protein
MKPGYAESRARSAPAAAIAAAALFLAAAAGHVAGALRAQAQSGASNPATSGAASVPRVPVLVELFTSEGCSSCPPADKFLAWLEQNQPVAGAQIIILEQHVDYWDGQGWNDPFSQSAITNRQKEYALALNAGVYTPQMVVDGMKQFVGTDGKQALAAIDSARTAADTTIQLAWTGAATGETRAIHVHAGYVPDMDNNVGVMLAITESHLHSDVRGGENAGRALEHAGVVRGLLRLGHVTPNAETSFDSQSEIKLNKKWKPENLRAVVFMQDPKSRRVLASAEIPY